MGRTLLIVLAAWAIPAIAQPKSGIPKPQYQRTLDDDQSQHVEKLAATIETSKAANDLLAAIRAAQDVVDLRVRVQGDDHWQVRDARIVLADLRRPAYKPEEQQRLVTADRQAREATALFEEGKYKSALDSAVSARATRKEILGDEHGDAVVAATMIGTVRFALGEYAEAQRELLNVVRIRRRISGDWHPETAHALDSLGRCYRLQDDRDAAEPLCREALGIRRNAFGDDHLVTAKSLLSMANQQLAPGSLREAEQLYLQALAIRRKQLPKHHPDIAQCLHDFGMLYEMQGALNQAMPLYKEAWEIRQKALPELHPDRAKILERLGGVYLPQQDYRSASDCIARAAFIFLKNDLQRDLARCFNTHGQIHMLQSRYRDAEFQYGEALRIIRGLPGKRDKELADIQVKLTSLYLAKKEFDKAILTGQESLDLCERAFGQKHTLTGVAYYNLGAAYSNQGKYEQAAQRYEVAARVLREQRGLAHLNTTTSLRSLAFVYICLGKYTKAEEVLREAAESYEAGRASSAEGFGRSLTAGKESPYELQALCYAALNRPREAFAALERHEGRGLLDELTARESKRSGVADNKSPVPDLAAIQASLPADSALLAWVSNSSESVYEQWGCVLCKSGEPHWERLRGTGPEGSWTTEDKEMFMEFCFGVMRGSASLARCQELAIRLRALLIAPLEKHLSGTKRLFVVSADTLAPLDVLTENYQISYVPAVSFLAQLRPSPGFASERLFALGDPEFTRLPPRDKLPEVQNRVASNWKRLPGTRTEVTGIAKMFPNQAKILLDSSASELELERLREGGDLASFRYLHFATHGRPNNAAPFNSALILAQAGILRRPRPDPKQPVVEGKLTAADVLRRWELNADLVTLSACETALGHKEGGDGNLGFAQAFLAAGARSVCVSLWKVDDAATSLLMHRFYENLRGKRTGIQPMPKADALAEAKHWLRNLPSSEAKTMAGLLNRDAAELHRGKDEEIKIIIPSNPVSSTAKGDKPFAHPRYWAAFVLIGDPN